MKTIKFLITPMLLVLAMAYDHFVHAAGAKEVAAIWPLIAMAAVSALANMQQQKAKQEQEANNMQANAEAIRNSPWTGMKASMMSGTGGSMMGAGMQGGLAGAMFGSQFSGGAAKPTAAGVAPQAAPVAQPAAMTTGYSPWVQARPNMYSNAYQADMLNRTS